MSPHPPTRYPLLQDAVRRAPVLVHGKPGRLFSVGGDRRTPNGRCRVQLASGAWLTPRIYDVEVVDDPTVPNPCSATMLGAPGAIGVAPERGQHLCGGAVMAHDIPPPALARFWAKVDKSGGDHSCWTWTAALSRDGYGNFRLNAEGTAQAHRLAYEVSVGPIPDGLQIDHVCRNKRCVNPAHLEPVTQAENMRRRAEAQTHCKNGHEFTPENTRFRTGEEGRACRACNLEAVKRYQRRKKSVG